MTFLAIPIAPLAYAFKGLLVTNPILGIAVGATAVIGYTIYEETRK